MARSKQRSKSKTGDLSAPTPGSSSADATGESSVSVDQRLPENLEQVGAASEQVQNTDAAAGAPNAAPPPNPTETDAVPLFAVTMVNLAGKYYEPGMQLEESQIAKDEDAIPALLEAGAIREG